MSAPTSSPPRPTPNPRPSKPSNSTPETPPPTSPAPASIRSNSSPSTTSPLLLRRPARPPTRTLPHPRPRPPTPTPTSALVSLPTARPLNCAWASASPPASPSKTAAPSPSPSPSRLPVPPSSFSARASAKSTSTSIHLADQDDLPVTQQLTFSLKSAAPFPRTGQLEIANADETLRTTLSVASGSLVLQNPHTLLATLDPLKAFGNSAFGPLRLRPVSPDGTTGDWLPLVNLVRLPTFKDLHCPPDTTLPCTISGSSLYLVDSIATDADFTTPTTVPEGFVGTTLSLPRPAKTGFYLRLRDDPTPANSVTLPILPEQALTDH